MYTVYIRFWPTLGGLCAVRQPLFMSGIKPLPGLFVDLLRSPCPSVRCACEAASFCVGNDTVAMSVYRSVENPMP
jgi:hypothetical protein